MVTIGQDTSSADSRANPRATVLITTKDRKDDLGRAVASALEQTVDLEVLVVDDGSSDGTSDFIRRRFPGVRVERNEKALGIIGARNKGVALASSPIVVTIDDDCLFPSRETVSQTLAEFGHPRVGVVSIPSVDVLIEDPLRQPDPRWRDEVYVSGAFRGGVNAMRRDLFLKLGGYRYDYVRQAEEQDYMLRMLNAGYVVRQGAADPVHHLKPPGKNSANVFLHNARSNVLHLWYNVPMPYFPIHLMATTVNLLKHGAREGGFVAAWRGAARGYCRMMLDVCKRKPVSRRAYRLSRALTRRGPMRIEEIEPMLPVLS